MHTPTPTTIAGATQASEWTIHASTQRRYTNNTHTFIAAYTRRQPRIKNNNNSNGMVNVTSNNDSTTNNNNNNTTTSGSNLDMTNIESSKTTNSVTTTTQHAT